MFRLLSSCAPITSVLLLLLTASARAQSGAAPALDPAKSLTQYLHENWSTEDGLPQSTINHIAQTADGYVWLATEEGLARFDGTGFVVFDKTNTPAFGRSHAVKRLYAEADGSLWVATRGGGLLRRSDDDFRSLADTEFEPAAPVSDVLRDDGGTLWIATYGSGIVRLEHGQMEEIGLDQGLTSEAVTELEAGPSGAIWIGTDQGLDRYDDGEVRSYGARLGRIHSLLTEPDGTLWIGSEGGLHRLTSGTPESIAINGGPRAVLALHKDRDGTVWIGTDGAGVMRVKSGRIDAFPEDHHLASGRIFAFMEDREGNLWIGAEGRGLSRLRDGMFAYYTTVEGLSHDLVLSVTEAADGSIWVGTEGGGLSRIMNGRATPLSVGDRLANSRVASVYGASNGDVWIGTLGGGLSRWRNGRVTSFSTSDGLPSDAVFALHEDREGLLWIGTSGGLARFDGEEFRTYGPEDGLSSPQITAIFKDRTGDLWVGTYDGGLNRLSDGRFVSFTTQDGLGSDLVLTLHEDEDGGLWIGTYEGGLTRYRNGEFHTFTTADGLFSDNVYQILEDESGHLWMSSNKGISRVAKSDLEDVAAGRTQRLHVEDFGRSDGLKDSELNGGSQPAGWRARDGRLWFPTLEGVVSVDPENMKRNGVEPPVIIEQVRVDQEVLSRRSDAELSPGKHKVEFRFAALSLTAPEKVRYRYRLVGYDDAWSEASGERFASYTNLPPGRYTFRVIASNNDGIWNERGAAFAFDLKPFFYQTTWFWILFALGVTALAAGVYRLRVRHLRVRQRELEATVAERTRDLRAAKEKIEGQAEKLRELDRFKMQFFANVSHEFRTPLTMIAGPLENLLTGYYGPLTETVRRQVEIMLRHAMRLTRLINQLLDLSKLEDGKMRLQAVSRDIVPFVEGVVLSCTAFAQRKGIELTCHSESERIPVCFEPDKLEKVLFNLLSNASKFTPSGGCIEVCLSERAPDAEMPEGSVTVHVRDTGKGIPAEELPHIFDRFRQVDGSNTREHEGTGIGLALAKELVLLHRGTIDVESTVGDGTRFTIVLPKGRSHLRPDDIGSDMPDDEIEMQGGAMAELASAAFDFMHAQEEAPRTAEKASDDAPLILIVDDNKDVREYVADLLADTYRVETAADGREGLRRAQELIPDLILSDVMMPKMDGNELCRRVKSSPELDHIPVILLTARATHELKIEGLEVGADDYVPKPFSARELRVRIKNLLKIRSQERELKAFNEQLEEKVQHQYGMLLRQRQRYEESLLAAKEKAESSDRLKSSILNNLSHEFRTPLAAIMGYTEVLKEEIPTELVDFAEQIERGGRRLLRTLEALLEFSTLEADETAGVTEPTELVRAAQAALANVASAGRGEHLKLAVRPSGNEEIWADLDPAALNRILTNLLDNAVKFTPEGEVIVECSQEDDEIRLRIRDTGIGMSTGFVPRMFDAFEQESDGLTRAFEGMGLGLTITRRLVECMDGTISVQSEPGRGTEITVAFPSRGSVETTHASGDGARLHARATAESISIRAVPDGKGE